ncbi:MAG: autotransporter-associated beta strand repeat-containing protein [Verrucomicrobiota bacterium]
MQEGASGLFRTIFIGHDTGGNGTVTVSGGYLGGSNGFVVGFLGGTGLLTITGGTADVVLNGMSVGVSGGTGTVNVAGGTLTTSIGATVGLGFGGGTGTLSVTSGTASITGLFLDQGTLSLSGGLLATGSITASANSLLFFSGGTLQALADAPAFITGGNPVLAGAGLTEDTAGFDVTIGQNLTGTGDLTKAGEGRLTLTGTNSYTGASQVQAGTLQFGQRASLYNSATASWTATNLTVSNGATLALNVGGTGEFTPADIAQLAALGTSTGGFTSGARLGLDTTNAPEGIFTYNGALNNPNGGANRLGLVKLGEGTLVLSNSLQAST